MQGIIKRLVEKRGFGFIAVAGGKKDDVFFYCSGCVGKFEDLRVDDPVIFEIEKSKKGNRAVAVRVQKSCLPRGD